MAADTAASTIHTVVGAACADAARTKAVAVTLRLPVPVTPATPATTLLVDGTKNTSLDEGPAGPLRPQPGAYRCWEQVVL